MVKFDIDGDIYPVDCYGYGNGFDQDMIYLGAVNKGVLSRTLGVASVTFMGMKCNVVIEAVGVNDVGEVVEIKPVMLFLTEELLPYIALNGKQLEGVNGGNVRN